MKEYKAGDDFPPQYKVGETVTLDRAIPRVHLRQYMAARIVADRTANHYEISFYDWIDKREVQTVVLDSWFHHRTDAEVEDYENGV